MVEKFFNTTGPCDPERHYMLPPKERLIGADLDRLLKNELYWVLHAPRQTGKTTFLKSWMKELNDAGECIACYVSVERCQGFPRAEEAISAICEAIDEYAGRSFPPELVPPAPTSSPASALSTILTSWARIVAPKSLVILFDEVDVLQDQAMISFLRQLRGGFADRGVGKFPISVALVGMRDLRDYLIQSKDGENINPGSPFNIKEASACIGSFSKNDVQRLLYKHTEATGQVFEEKAIEQIFSATNGQPWLVNALAKKLTWEMVKNVKEPITEDHVIQAREKLIRSRSTHLHSLAERLKQSEVKKVIQAIITGETDENLSRSSREVELCMDLGLVVWDDGLCIANDIYREIIGRELSSGYQDGMAKPEFKWKHADGSLDLIALLKEFQDFWRWNSDEWEERANYTEAFPHLLLMGFLQRVISGGASTGSATARIEREYAAGRGRVDLAVQWQNKWYVIETKIVHPKRGMKYTLGIGLEQCKQYSDTMNAIESYLVIFDRTPAGRAKSWEERLYFKEMEHEGRKIMVVGA